MGKYSKSSLNEPVQFLFRRIVYTDGMVEKSRVGLCLDLVESQGFE